MMHYEENYTRLKNVDYHRGDYYFPFLWMANVFTFMDDIACIYTYRITKL